MATTNGGYESAGFDGAATGIDRVAQLHLDRSAPFVVALGASAGGVEALEQFFGRVPPDSGMTFLVVQHLSPDFKSLMDDILSRRTTMPVRIAEDGTLLAPNTVYLNPPRTLVSVRDGRLVLAEQDPSTTVAHPIDHLLRSLATDRAGRSAAIILSGTGTDGSRGVVDFQRAGGLVIAQEPATAGFDGMPRSAIGTGCVDLTLTPDCMLAPLVAAAEGKDPRASQVDALVASSGLPAVIARLRDAYGIDFAEYKLPTIARRTERRMRLRGDADLDAYVARLASDPAELDALYRDLLIGVTQFFRDPDAYEPFEKTLLPQLVDRLSPDEELRIWVAGCATGEEAYSMAMLARECLDARGAPNAVKIFATDIHREALRFAALGRYDAESVAQVGRERRARFFIATDDGYQITPSIRSMVVVAPHNVMSDVPFNKLDLITCRNLLIYLQPSAQRRVLGVFQFGLKPGGLLFLGSSESISAELAEELEVVDPHWKIFRKRAGQGRPAEMATTRPTSALRARMDMPAPPTPAAVLADANLAATFGAVLDATMAPSLLIGSRRNLVHTFGGGSRYLQVPEGRPTVDAVEMLRGDLRVAVTGALQTIVSGREQVVRYRGLGTEVAGQSIVVDLAVRGVKNRRTGEVLSLVTIEEQGPAPANAAPPVPVDQISRDQVTALESQLREAKQNLQTTIEELEASNEELQAANEELVASNEELQTTNEELHSVNQELFTVNTEFQRKIGELTELTHDMDLLIASTEVHTLFLDREFRIRRFTAQMAELFHLVGADVGRRIDAFNHSLDVPTLIDDLRMVVATGTPYERQVRDADHRWFLMRALPYRRGTAIDGAVLTLIDINGLKRLEAEARSTHDQLSSILTNSPHPVFIRDREGRYVVVDESFRRLAGRDPTGLKPDQIFSVDVAAMFQRDDGRILGEGRTVEAEETIPTAAGPQTFLSVRFPMRDADGNIVGIGGIHTDVTSLKRAEAEARDAANRRDRFLATLSHELRNPLAAVLNASRVITRGQLRGEELERWHKLILERSLHMTHLVDDLLDVARLTQDKLTLKCAPVELRAIAQGVIDEVGATFRERDIELVTTFEDGLAVFGDTTRLHQLQVNLLTNAARHTPPGGRTTFTLKRSDGFAEISVADSGEGIAADVMPRIFELFVQGDAPGARGRDGGLGVGLALVKRIAELHGGSVDVSSPGLGGGSKFRVRLPLVAEPAITHEEDARAPDRPRRVLLVDDDPSSRSGMRALLEMDGIVVVTAGDGVEAIAALATRPFPDLVLLDIGLPGMDGYEVCRKIRELDGAAKLTMFALTGFGQDSDRDVAHRAGFDGHLTKPVDVDDIYALYARTTR